MNKTLACLNLILTIVCAWLAYSWQVNLEPALPIVPIGLATLALVCLVQTVRYVSYDIPYGWFDAEMQQFTALMSGSLFCVATGAGLLWYALHEHVYVHPLALLWCACLIGCGLLLASITLFQLDRRR